MNVLFYIGVVVGFAALVAGIVGVAMKKMWLVAVAAVVILVVAVVMIAMCAKPASADNYRVVYSKDSDIVVIDDKDGSTKRYKLDDIIHSEGEFNIGDHVTVITNAAGKPVFITTDTAIEIPSKEPSE